MPAQALLQLPDQAALGVLQQVGAQRAVERMPVGQRLQPAQAVLLLAGAGADRRRLLQVLRVAGKAGDVQGQLIAQGLQGVLMQLLAIA